MVVEAVLQPVKERRNARLYNLQRHGWRQRVRGFIRYAAHPAGIF